MTNKLPNEKTPREWFPFKGDHFYKVIEVNSRYELTSAVCVGYRTNGWMTLRLSDGTVLKRRSGSDNWYLDPVMAVDGFIRDTAVKHSLDPFRCLMLPSTLNDLYRFRNEVSRRFQQQAKAKRQVGGEPRKEKSPFEDRWHIVSMSGRDENPFRVEVQAFIEFEANGTGYFQFGYLSGEGHLRFGHLRGYMDWRPGTRDGQPAVEWTWVGAGGDDTSEMTGRGWAKLEGDDLNGMIVIHLGDESDFVAKRAKAPKRPKKRE
jgi:hypothetical protein